VKIKLRLHYLQHSAVACHNIFLSEYFFILLSYINIHISPLRLLSAGIYIDNDKGSFQRSPKLSTGLYLTKKHIVITMISFTAHVALFGITGAGLMRSMQTTSATVCEFEVFFV